MSMEKEHIVEEAYVCPIWTIGGIGIWMIRLYYFQSGFRCELKVARGTLVYLGICVHI